MKMDDEIVLQAYLEAKMSRDYAHAPYSNFHVGSCVVTKDHKLYRGFNIENGSLPAGHCSERTALTYAMCENKGECQFLFMVIVTKTPVAPCGLCLQFIKEFCNLDFEIFIGDLKGLKQKFTLKDFLPTPFEGYTPD